MSLAAKLAKTTAKGVDSYFGEESTYLTKDYEYVTTPLPIFNIALSGKINGGFTPGVTILAGKSGVGKTLLSWLGAASFQRKYPEGVVLFYDSEFGTKKEYLKGLGVDISRVIHIPVTDIEQLNFDLMAKLEAIEPGEKVYILMDSLGQIASKKEVEDALAEKSVQDMSRAKKMKALFRQVTPIIAKKELFFVGISHTYEGQGLFSTTEISGGCVVKGTKIVMHNGALKEIENIKPGDLVKTKNGVKEVLNTWTPETLENGTPEIYEIEFYDGYTVKCSPDHKFLVDKTWVKAKDLKANDTVETIDYKILVKVKSIKKLPNQEVYDINVADVHHYILENGVVSHNSGIIYSADTILVLSKSKNKEGQEQVGVNINIMVRKSRYVKEGAKFTAELNFETGFKPFSGLIDMLIELGFVIKPSNGYYQVLDPETGEFIQDGKKFRLKEIENAEILGPIISSDKFKKAIQEKFMLVNDTPTIDFSANALLD